MWLPWLSWQKEIWKIFAFFCLMPENLFVPPPITRLLMLKFSTFMPNSFQCYFPHSGTFSQHCRVQQLQEAFSELRAIHVPDPPHPTRQPSIQAWGLLLFIVCAVFSPDPFSVYSSLPCLQFQWCGCWLHASHVHPLCTVQYCAFVAGCNHHAARVLSVAQSALTVLFVV